MEPTNFGSKILKNFSRKFQKAKFEFVMHQQREIQGQGRISLSFSLYVYF